MSKNGVLLSELGLSGTPLEQNVMKTLSRFVTKFTNPIVAVLSCFDRVIFKGGAEGPPAFWHPGNVVDPFRLDGSFNEGLLTPPFG